MSACDGISIGADYDCEDPIVAGVDQRLILIDLGVFRRAIITESITIPNLIELIVLTEIGDAAFAFQGIRKSLNPQSAYVPATVSSGFDHQVQFSIFDISQEQKNNIERMALAPVVAIIENANNPGNANSVFELYGQGLGLEMQASDLRINQDLETNGAYTIDLKTSDDSGKEPHLPNSLFGTDYNTTRSWINDLLIPVIA